MLHEVVAALIVRSQKILLGLRSVEREFYPNVWDVFGGHVEPGENHEQTLVRELQEELGITPREWKYLETITQPSEQLTLHLYLVSAWTGTPTNRQLEDFAARSAGSRWSRQCNYRWLTRVTRSFLRGILMPVPWSRKVRLL